MIALLVLAVYLVLCFAGRAIAVRKGRSPWLGWCLGFVPLGIGIVVLLFLPARRA